MNMNMARKFSYRRQAPIHWCVRSDYVRNQAGPDIDLMMVHMYPDSWLSCSEDCKRDWAVRWVRPSHVQTRRLPCLEDFSINCGRHLSSATPLPAVAR